MKTRADKRMDLTLAKLLIGKQLGDGGDDGSTAPAGPHLYIQTAPLETSGGETR